MKINDYIKEIKKLDACGNAIKDALNYETSQDLWDKCERGDWMLWLIGKKAGNVGDKRRKQLTLTACKCARLSLKYVKENELRPLKAIETAEMWARGEDDVTIDDVRDAANAANAACAITAANAGYVATAANAGYVAYAAANAGSAARAITAVDAVTLKQCADIVRKDYPEVDKMLEGE